MQSIAYIPGSNGSGNASLMTVQNVRSSGASDILVNTVIGVPNQFFGSMGAPHTFTDPVTGETITLISEATAVDFAGHVDSGKLVIDAIAPGYVDTRGSLVGDVVVIRPTTEWANNIFNILNADHNDGGTHKTNTVNPVGAVVDFAGMVAPSGWLMCDGSNVSRSTYASLFAILNPVIGVSTISISTPGLVTFTAHGLVTGDSVYFTTTGALPTGLSANTVYYAIRMDANTFRLATSYANAAAGTAINTTGSQSGVHTSRRSPYGVGDGTTTFTLPDARGRVIAGNDQMGGTSADRLTQNINGDVVGQTGGTQLHKHSAFVEIAGSTSVPSGRVAFNGIYYGGGASGKNAADVSINQIGDNDSSVQPTIIMNKIIKT